MSDKKEISKYSPSEELPVMELYNDKKTKLWQPDAML